MVKQSKTPKRPRDVISNSVHIMRVLTGQIREEATPEPAPGSHAARGRLGGLKGGKARAEAMSAKKRSASAKRAAKARWSK